MIDTKRTKRMFAVGRRGVVTTAANSTNRPQWHDFTNADWMGYSGATADYDGRPPQMMTIPGVGWYEVDNGLDEPQGDDFDCLLAVIADRDALEVICVNMAYKFVCNYDMAKLIGLGLPVPLSPMDLYDLGFRRVL